MTPGAGEVLRTGVEAGRGDPVREAGLEERRKAGRVCSAMISAPNARRANSTLASISPAISRAASSGYWRLIAGQSSGSGIQPMVPTSRLSAQTLQVRKRPVRIRDLPGEDGTVIAGCPAAASTSCRPEQRKQR